MFGLTKRWERKVRDYCDSQYEKIKVLPGELNFYYKCHLTSTHYAIKGEHTKIALVTQRDNGTLLPIVHFLNYDGKNFIDNSLGHWAKHQEYRFIRWVSKDEFFKTPAILVDTKKFFSSMAGFFTNTFGNVGN